jgi:putative lipoprotein
MFNQLRNLCMGLLALSFLTACDNTNTLTATNTQATMKILEGEAYYRERMMLPPGAVLEVTLEDVSKMDVASTQISSTTQVLEGGPPYAFKLEYDAALIEDKMRYSLRAKVTLSDKLLMTSTEHLDPFKNTESLNKIKLSKIASAAPKKALVEKLSQVDTGLAVVSVNPLAPLGNTYWKLLELGGETVEMAEKQKREAFLQLNDELGTVKGFGSCNNFQGTFAVKGNDLSFGPIAATRKACLNNMDLEASYFKMLEQTGYYSIHEHNLTLMNNAKKPIARFEAVYFN